MKKVIYALLFGALTFGMVACGEKTPTDDPGKTPSGENTITLSADKTTIEMSADTQGDTALTLTWNAASNMGTGARINYSVLFDKKGNEFMDAYEVDLGANITTISFTGLELNKIMIDELGYAEGETGEIEVCVYAMIADESVGDVVSNSVELTIAVFKAAAEIVYMVGPATTAGWDHTVAVPMNPIVGEQGGFTWSGELMVGELKFIASQLGWVPGWGPAEEEGKLYCREKLFEDEAETIDTPDPKFNITVEGNYKININIEKLTYSITQTSGPEHFEMNIAGSALESATAMRRSGYLFFYSGILAAGNYHFETPAGVTFGPESADAAPSESAVVKNTTNEWKVPAANKLYKMTLYTKSGKELVSTTEHTPFNTIYLIGDATSAGWNITSAVEMTKKDQFTQTWTGQLKVGELKFTCDKKDDWMGVWYLADAAGKAPTGEVENMIYIDKQDKLINRMGMREFDQKWKIQEAGTYTITLNQRDETVVIAKQ